MYFIINIFAILSSVLTSPEGIQKSISFAAMVFYVFLSIWVSMKLLSDDSKILKLLRHHRYWFGNGPVNRPEPTQSYSAFTFIPLCAGVSEPIKHVLSQVGIGVAMKSHFMLSSVFSKPKDCVSDADKRGLVYEIPCRDCDSAYIGETGRSLKTRKREHIDAVRGMDLKKSTLCQHIAECDHFIALDDTKILKMEPHYRKHLTAESFLINKRSKECFKS